MIDRSGSPVVTLYGRPGCHLCDEARAMLLDLQSACTGASRFELCELDIDADETLLREMLELIPVIEVEGDRISTLVADRDAVIRRLDTVRT